jgi:hypothetical protein
MQYPNPALVRRWTRGIGVPLDPILQFNLEKAKLTQLVQNSNGKFTMRVLNGKPYSDEKPD